MKINHDLRHRITVVEAQGKALIEQKVELEAYLQTKEQEMGALRSELGKLREKLQGEPSQNGDAMKVAKASLLQERRNSLCHYRDRYLYNLAVAVQLYLYNLV